MHHRNARQIVSLIVLTGALLLAPLAQSQGDPIRYVATTGTDTGDCTDPDNPCATVQYAVDQALPGDEVRVAAGTYTDVHQRAGITQTVYITKTLSVRGGYTTTNSFADPPDPGANPTTLDAQGQGRVFYIIGAISPTIEGLRITGGRTKSDYGNYGGGVCVVTATVTISNNLVFSNTAATGGGGIYLQSSPATLSGNVIATNTCSTYYSNGYGGGLLLLESAATLSDNLIADNIAGTSYCDGRGGGVYLWSSPAELNSNTISGNQAGGWSSGGGVYLHSSGLASLSGNTITTNYALYGGGLYLEESDSTLNGNTIADNHAFTAGGIALYESDATISGNTVSDNTASESGGLWLSGSKATITGNTIISNRANFGSGGGLYLWESSAVISDNIISNNVASGIEDEDDGGGGLYIDSSAPVLNGNIIVGNTTGYDGGGVYLWESNATLVNNVVATNTAVYKGGGMCLDMGSTTLNGNVVVSNSAEYGGGLYLRGNPTLTNDVIADNRASALGSGLCVYGWTSPRLLHTTIARNYGGDGSGICIQTYHSTIALTNTILVGHTVGITVAAGSTVTLEATLWSTGTWANDTDWAGAGTVTTGTVNIWGDPAFVDPAAQDYHIGVTSAARDAGIDAGVTTDIDGQSRPFGSGYDIGADEFHVSAALTVSKQAAPILVQPGAPLTYTLRVTNTGNVDLHATITDVLPAHITPGGTRTWTPIIPTPGGVWTEQVVVTVEPDYSGTLTNTVQVTTAEGATGTYTNITSAEVSRHYLYLPLVMRSYQ